MRALIIGDKERHEISVLIRHAKSHVVSYLSLLRQLKGIEIPVGDNPKHCIILPIDFRVVYSHEQQTEGTAHHLSVSVNGTGYPSEQAVEEIMKEFGFENKIRSGHCLVWNEPEARAINVLEYINPNRETEAVAS